MPMARAHHAAAALNGKIYVLGGENAGALDVVEEYDPSADLWRTLAPLPSVRNRLAVVPVAGRMLAIGGTDLLQWKQVNQYDPLTTRGARCLRCQRDGTGTRASS